MKQKLFFAIALGVLLFVPGFNVQAQLQTTPPPPPDRESSIIPDPIAPPREQAPARRQTPPRAQTPAPAGTPPARQAPAQPAPARPAAQTPAARQTAAQQTPAPGIPDKGLFWGGMIGGGALMPDAYYASEKTYTEAAVGGGLFVGYDFGLFTGQAELLFANEKARIRKSSSSDGYYEYFQYSGMLLQIPLVAKMDLHLWRFVLQPLAGLYLNFGLGDADLEYDDDYSGWGTQTATTDDWESPLLGWLVGGTLGFRIGRGFLLWDIRYMSNLGNTKVGGQEWAYRNAILSSIGYQYYFRQK